MIDLHTHLLPNIDDGAADVLESVEMLKDSKSQGVNLIAVTPHCRIRKDGDVAEFIRRREERLKLLKSEMEKQNIDFAEFILGAEVYLDHDLVDCHELDRLCLSGTSSLLLEFPHSGYKRIMSEWVYAVTLCGITPIIAHIERYGQREEVISDLRGMNVVYQINADSFLKLRSRAVLKKILSTDNRFFVSSDMHNVAERACFMEKAFDKAKKMYGDKAETLFFGVAEEILKKKIMDV